MLEVTGEDIERLGDADLRTLVARLALAELAKQKLQLSAVTAGGHQDAKDGGVDVRVDLKTKPEAPDFVPRAQTGFQVKATGMPAKSIEKEMRPKGVLRSAISELVDLGGSYIIVSAKGTVTDTSLANRKKAMRDALVGHSRADNLLTDFYDRERIANWVNAYPGTSAWVRAKTGGTISGWRPIGRWSATATARDNGYLLGDHIFLVDEQSKGAKLPISEGIERLRTSLCVPGNCIRLIGMSGLGKTRLVEALFEQDIGQVPLDPSLSLYTDYSEDITPSALTMARQLVEAGTRTILIVDNCSPATHACVAKVCRESSSQVSLLTVEYDVREDEPERTAVFRLTGATNALIQQWLEREFPRVSQVDRTRIAEFSDGNFRVARALTETLQHGETLGHFRDQDLFERIFFQRNLANHQLLLDAEILALLYSFDAEGDASGFELAHLARLARRSVDDLYGTIDELHRRDVLQARGRWRAVLPQALANRLAARALARIQPLSFDSFCESLPRRMLKSLSRRLGFLHGSVAAQKTVARWLQPTGPLGDLFAESEDCIELVLNFAPVAPEAVLTKIEMELDSPSSSRFLSPSGNLRQQCIELLKSLAYEPTTFELAANLLARFVAAEGPGHGLNSATSSFEALFHLYLSGTAASPAIRRELARSLILSDDQGLHRAGVLALEGLLKSGHFSSYGSFEFGARPRDFGWQPLLKRDIYEWYDEAITLALEFVDRIANVKKILARSAHGLWCFGACHDALDHASKQLASAGGWSDGWMALRVTLRSNGEGMSNDVRARLVEITERLKPANQIEWARVLVLDSTTGYDVAAGEPESDVLTAWERASQAARDIGREIASEGNPLTCFLVEIMSQNLTGRAYQFGRGLAEGTRNLRLMWADMLAAYRAAPLANRNPILLGGFLYEANKFDSEFSKPVLDAAINDPDLAPRLPYLQSCVALDAEGLARLVAAAREGRLGASDFMHLSSGVIAGVPAEPLVEMLQVLASLGNGIGVALEILFMHFYCAKDCDQPLAENLIAFGRKLLRSVDFSDRHAIRNHTLLELVKICLSGSQAIEDSRFICANLCLAINNSWESTHHDLLECLFRLQPEVLLDAFLLGGLRPGYRHLLGLGFIGSPPNQSLAASAKICAWADQNPQERYPLLGGALAFFSDNGRTEVNGLAPLYLHVLAKAPDKKCFLSGVHRQFQPLIWSASLADVLERRRANLAILSTDPDPDVRQWHRDAERQLTEWIADERQREGKRQRQHEMSFE